MSIKLLEQIGLTEDQSKIYFCLVSSGTLTARKIGMETMVNRSLVYKILKELVEFGLVIENNNSRLTTTFTALHPSRLHSLVNKKETEFKLADQALHEAMHVLGAQFNLINKKPSVRFYEGLEGIKMLHKDIIHTGKDIKLIRSPLDKHTFEIGEMTKKQIQAQVDNDIHARVIGPTRDDLSSEELKMRDKERLVTRCQIPKEDIDIGAQVIIYGDKVALTSYEDSMITTIVEDKSIANTFSVLFELIWKKYSK